MSTLSHLSLESEVQSQPMGLFELQKATDGRKTESRDLTIEFRAFVCNHRASWGFAFRFFDDGVFADQNLTILIKHGGGGYVRSVGIGDEFDPARSPISDGARFRSEVDSENRIHWNVSGSLQPPAQLGNPLLRLADMTAQL
jgi:hypothetical protein